MKLWLVKPMEVSDSMAPPLGLGYLAAALGKEHETTVIDCILLRLSPAGLARLAGVFRPDIIGLTLHSFERALVREYLLNIRSASPNTVTVLGGPHVSGDPAGTLLEYGRLVDFAFVGEAEKGFRMLVELLQDEDIGVNAKSLKKVPGLVYRGLKGIQVNPRWMPKPKEIGMPRWDLLVPETYPRRPPGAFFRQFPTAPVSISRGCPSPCTFCAVGSVMGRKIRYRPIDSVMEELRLLHDRHGIREFHFVDDNFTHDRNYVLKFCDALASGLPGISWTCPNGVKIDSLDDELLSAMKISGCYALSVGIEAGNQEVLDKIGKAQKVDRVRHVIEKIKNHGMSARGFFLFGLPEQSSLQMEDTIRFSLELSLDMALFSLFHPFPGTLEYDRLKDKGEIRNQAKTLAEVAYVPKGLSARQLKSLQRKAFLLFWLRPRILLNLVREIRTPTQFYYILGRMIRWLAAK